MAQQAAAAAAAQNAAAAAAQTAAATAAAQSNVSKVRTSMNCHYFISLYFSFHLV